MKLIINQISDKYYHSNDLYKFSNSNLKIRLRGKGSGYYEGKERKGNEQLIKQLKLNNYIID